MSRSVLIVLGSMLLMACSPSEPENAAPSTPAVSAAELTRAMLEGMGGVEALQAVQTLVQQGGGTRRHFGQIPATGAADPAGVLSALTETIDLANGRAAFDNMVQIGATPQQRAALVARYGLDQPLLVQYAVWLRNVFSGDMGDAIVMRQPVTDLIAENLPHSLRLGGLAFVFSTVVGIATGALAAV